MTYSEFTTNPYQMTVSLPVSSSPQILILGVSQTTVPVTPQIYVPQTTKEIRQASTYQTIPTV